MVQEVPVQVHQFGIIWIKRGTGVIHIDLEAYPLHNDQLVCISPGQLLCVKTGVALEGCYISFSAEFLLMAEGQVPISFMDTLYERRSLPVMPLVTEIRYETEAAVGMMNKEYSRYGLLRLPIVQGLLNILIAYIAGIMQVRQQEHIHDRDGEMVRKFMKLVKQYFLSRKMVSDYASELCVSPNYLNRIVKKISGFTASYHIQQQIILEAKRQAMYSSLSMKEVAYSLGFNDYAHFSKFFKNNSGMNFTCFKNGVNRRA